MTLKQEKAIQKTYTRTLRENMKEKREYKTKSFQEIHPVIFSYNKKL